MKLVKMPWQLRQRVLLPVCALAIGAPAWAQAPASSSSPTDPEEESIELSPFEVDASRDIGYYAENTLAGSRLQTKVSDLAASITVVTRQQLSDTAAIDINDVFLYESNTEGTGNYTDFNIDTRGAVQDRSAGFQGGAPSLPSAPSTANRMRGIGSADKMRDYYPGNARLPFDVYNTDSVEINRGPNSILFGLGSPAGIINQSAARARIGPSTNQVEMRYGTDDAFRASVAFNRTLIQDKLAVYVAALYDARGFPREPSRDITRRQYGAVTFKPFPKTTLRANFENYTNSNRRPNSVTPRDFVSPWIAAGRPGFNPVTGMLTVGGVTSGPYRGNVAADVTALQVASGNTVAFDGNTRPVLMIEDGQELLWIMRQLSSTPNVANVPAAFTFDSPFRTTKSLGPETQRNIILGRPAGITFAQRGVNDQSIYDWESINIISGNFGEDDAKTFNIELEQQILDNLHVQLGWYREDFDSRVDYYISQQTGVTLYVDTNTHHLDGTANPHFGRPFVEITQPDAFEHPEENYTARATAAYVHDFSKHEGWGKWLGRHQLMGLVQEQNVKREQLRYRPLVASNHLWNPVLPDVWASNTTQNAIERRFYVGDSTGVVTKDPGLYPDGTRTNTLRWFNRTLPGTDPATGETGQWVNDNALVDTDLHFVSFRNRQKIESRALVLQSFFLDDRIITTLGRRRDKSDAAQSPFLTRLPDGRSNPANLHTYGTPQVVAGYTTSYGVVAKPLPWLDVHYNESDNFQPAAFQTDFFGTPLPLPNGDGKDYGFSVTFFEGKLYARINWFEASSNLSRGAVVQQPLTRTLTIDDTFFRNWAQLVTGSPTNNSAAVNGILKLPALHQAAEPGSFFGIPVAATSTVETERLEFQLVYNPTRNWNLKLTAGQQETIFRNIAPEWNAWVAERMPIWTSTTAAGFTPFWSATSLELPGIDLGDTERVQDWFFTNVDAIMRTAQRSEGKVTQGQREWRASLISNYRFAEGRYKGFGVGGAIRWEDEAAIGYLGAAPDPDGIIRSLDVDQPVFDDRETHLDLWASYVFTRIPWLGDKTRLKLQLNIRNVFANGDLKAIAVNPDGQPTAFRIVDPQQWYLTATFDF